MADDDKKRSRPARVHVARGAGGPGVGQFFQNYGTQPTGLGGSTPAVPLLPGTTPGTAPKKTTKPAAKATKPPAKTTTVAKKAPAKVTTAAPKPTVSQITNSEEWAHAVLAAGKWPDNPDNVKFLMAFAQIEGGNWHNTAAYNVLGTTTGAPAIGTISGNNAGIQIYASWANGIKATVNMLKQSNMKPIADLLATGKAASNYTTSSPAADAIKNSWDPNGPDWTALHDAINQAGGPTLLSGQGSGTDSSYSGSTGGPAPSGPNPNPNLVSDVTSNQVSNTPPVPPGAAIGSNALRVYVEKNFPTFSWLLDVPAQKGQPSPGDTIEQMIKAGYGDGSAASDAKIQAAVGNTQWWLHTTTSQRQYEQLQYTSPTEFKLEKDQAAKVITAQAANQGVHFPPGSSQLNELVQEYLQFGWATGPGGEAALRAAIQSQSNAPGVSTLDSGYLNAYLNNPGTAEWTGGTGEEGFKQGLAGQSLTDKMVAHVQQLAGLQSGMKFSNADLIAIGTQAAQQNLSDDQLRTLIDNYSTTGHGQAFTPGYMNLVLDNGEQLVATGNAANPVGKRATLMDNAIYQVQQTLAQEGITGLSFGALRSAAQLGLEHNWLDQTVGGTAGLQGNPQNNPMLNYLKGVVGNSQGQQYSTAYIEAQLTTPWELAPPRNGASNDYTQFQKEILGNYLPGLKLSGLSQANLTKATDYYQKYLWGQPADQIASSMNSYLSTLAANQGGGAGVFGQAYTAALGANNTLATTFTDGRKSGNLADTAWRAVRNAVANAGKVGISPTMLNDLATEYMEHYEGEAGAQDWLSNIGPLVTGKGIRNVSPAFAQQVLANPSELFPSGGYSGTTSASTVLSNVLDAAQHSGYNIPAAELLHLTMMSEESGPSGWSATQAQQNIGDYAHANNLVWEDPTYVLGQQQGNSYDFPKDWGAYQADLDSQGANYVPNHAVNMLTRVEQLAAQQGVGLSYAQAVEVSKKALKGGLSNPTDIQPYLAPFVQLNAGSPAVGANPPAAGQQGITPPEGTPAYRPATVPVNTAPSLFQQLQGTASQYFQKPSDQVLQQWGRGIVGGTQTPQEFQKYLADQAAAKYPGFREQLITQNQTMDQATSALQQLVANTLELPGGASTPVDLAANPMYAKLLDGGFDLGKDGQQVANGGAMTQSQATDYLQSLPQWQYTMNAKTKAADLTQQILQTFGKVS